MKKVILICCWLLFTASAARSQSAFQKKDLFINGGVSFMNYRNTQYDGSERAGRTLPVFLSAEYGVNRLISVGPIIGYHYDKYFYRGNIESIEDDEMFKSHFVTTGLKGSLHFAPILEDKLDTDLFSEDLDIYTSVILGYEINRISTVKYFNYHSKLVAGASLGARYFLNYRMAIFAEVGPGVLGFGTVGATARF